MDDARIGQAALVKLNQENWQGQILLGRPVPACELEAYTATVASLLGKPPTDLNIKFVEGFVCPKCQANTDAEAAAAAAEAKAAPVAEAPAPQPVAAPPVPAASAPVLQPAPNVVNIHSHPLAPLAKHNEPWRGFTEGNGRTGYGGFDNNG